MAKIFIGFTPLHARNVQEIIKNEDGEIYCLFTKIWPDKEIDYNRLGFSLPSAGISRTLLYFLSFIRFSFQIRKLIKNKKQIELYVPHPNNIFTNYLFFCHEITTVNIYEDGILNYYDAPTNNKQPNAIFRLLSKACGLAYTSYSGHLSGLDARMITSGYFYRPSSIVSMNKFEKLFELTPEKQQTLIDEKTILFLDQDTSSQFSDTHRLKLIDDMLEKFSRTDYNYYYKPHHEYEAKFEMTKLPKNLRPLAAEKVIEAIKPGIVISFFSSALINIKQISPDTRCISLASREIQITINGERKTLDSLFLAASVECV